MIDIGGESTRPGSKPINENREWYRINKILKLLIKKIPISLDTRKSNIMKKELELELNLLTMYQDWNMILETINVLKNIKFHL